VKKDRYTRSNILIEQSTASQKKRVPKSQQRISGKSFNISIRGTALKQVDCVRYLGVIIDPTLYGPYTSLIAIISRATLIYVVTGHWHLQYYVCFIQLFFYHCDVVWCPTTAKFTAMLEEYTPNLYHHYIVASFLSL